MSTGDGIPDTLQTATGKELAFLLTHESRTRF